MTNRVKLIKLLNKAVDGLCCQPKSCPYPKECRKCGVCYVEYAEKMGWVTCKSFTEYEPVELEVLEKDEQKSIINLHKEIGTRHFYEAGKRLVQATIQKNQIKYGQLYRLKENMSEVTK